MNFYKRHIGDYLKDAGHLTLLEHGVYARLLDVYYTHEKPIPENKAGRLIGAKSKDELQAVADVLEEFFTLVDGAWHQKRADEEISKAKAKQDDEDGDDDQPAKSSKAERQKRYRERRKAMFDRLREHGVTMPFDATMDDLQDALLRVTVTPQRNASVTGDDNERRNVTATISQTPDTTSQTPDSRLGVNTQRSNSTEVGPGNSEGARATPGEISKAMRTKGVLSQPGDPRIIALAEQGVTIETVNSACEAARAAKPNESIGLGYVVAILKRWSEEAASMRVQGARAPQQQSPLSREEQNRQVNEEAKRIVLSRLNPDSEVIDADS